jgi:hypothetical protein
MDISHALTIISLQDRRLWGEELRSLISDNYPLGFMFVAASDAPPPPPSSALLFMLTMQRDLQFVIKVVK